MAIHAYTKGKNRKFINDIRVIEIVDLKLVGVMVLFSLLFSSVFAFDENSFVFLMTIMVFINIASLFLLKGAVLFYRDVFIR